MLSSPTVLNGNVSLQCPTAEYPCRAQSRRVSTQCPTATAEYPCSAQPQIIPAVSPQCPPQSTHAMPNRNRRASLQCPPQSTHAMPNRNRRVSLQCPTAEHPRNAQPYPCSAHNRRVSTQCPSATAEYPCSAPTTKYPCSAQPHNIYAVHNHQVSLQCPAAKRMHYIDRAIIASGWGCSKWIIYYYCYCYFLLLCLVRDALSCART